MRKAVYAAEARLNLFQAMSTLWSRPLEGRWGRELPATNKLSEKLRDQNVVFLGINDDGTGTVRNFNKKNGYTLTTLEDTSRKAHRDYMANAIPAVFIIGRDGVIVKHFVGTREEPDLVRAIEEAGKR